MRVRELGRHAASNARDDVNPVATPARLPILSQPSQLTRVLHRDPRIHSARVDTGESALRYTGDGEIARADAERSADDAAVATEPPLPETVAQHDSTRVGIAIVVFRQQAPDRRTRA